MVHIGTTLGGNILDCTNCGYAHVMPLPSVKEVDAYYQADRLSDEHAPDDWFDVEKAQWPYNSFVYAQWLSIIHGKAQDDIYRFLDIGCGSGWLLHAVDQYSTWQGTGIEPAQKPRQLAQAKGLNVVDSFKHLGEPYDAITMALVLEHLANPMGMLETAHEWLTDDGVILLTVPNDFTAIQEIARKKHDLPAWWVCDPHINYFSIDSIQNLVKQAGFTIEDVWTTFPMEQFLLQGYQYVGDENLGRWCYKQKMEFEMAYYKAWQPSQLRRLQRAWCNAGIGREVVVVGRKA